ncbi:ASCH domain-containing protein [Brevibacillus sp. BC25]|uniref:ASCH domain-containing protein n=1 Tax=Brevibacillus sp. BC25 TaxID=1144308 RepID=UPI000271304F|nr:ASCH domain-containing protein [Brevibacillus sp. BC25]EJL29974.1 ASCH domain-containing protein [Brevibacillus sp. BC25]
MKAITIHQPWATLIALGEKRFETRSWSTRYRGPIAIHAAKKVDKDICLEEPFRSVLAKHGYTVDNLPTGAVVAIANLTECWRSLGEGYLSGVPILQNGIKGQTKQISPQEDSFGWFESGRYAWEMTDVKQIDPVPAKGQQGLWNWGGERDV